MSGNWISIDMRGYRTGKRTHVRERILVTRDYTIMGILAVIACGFIVLVLSQLV